MTPRPLTADEAFAIARLRRRPLQTIKGARAWLPVPSRAGPIGAVDLVALERRGYVERWAFGDCWLWRATDEPPRFDRPHWRCEPIKGEKLLDGVQRFLLYANVGDGENGDAYASFYCEPIDPDHCVFAITEAVEAIEAMIARTVRERSTASPDIADAIAFTFGTPAVERARKTSDYFDELEAKAKGSDQ